MKWKSEYNLGNTEIDFQHESLIERINKYKENLSPAESNRSNILQILKFLVNYTKYHFESEEKFMALINYPKLHEHKIIHEDIVKTLRDKIKNFNVSNTNMNLELYYFLSSWINEHILVEDMQIKKYCNNINFKSSKCEITFVSIDHSIELIKLELEKIQESINNKIIEVEDLEFRRIIYLEEYFEKILSSISMSETLELFLSLNNLSIISVDELNILFNYVEFNKNETIDDVVNNYILEIKKIISL